MNGVLVINGRGGAAGTNVREKRSGEEGDGETETKWKRDKVEETEKQNERQRVHRSHTSSLRASLFLLLTKCS